MVHVFEHIQNLMFLFQQRFIFSFSDFLTACKAMIWWTFYHEWGNFCHSKSWCCRIFLIYGISSTKKTENKLMDQIGSFYGRLAEIPLNLKNKPFVLSVFYLPLLIRLWFSCAIFQHTYCTLIDVSELDSPMWLSRKISCKIYIFHRSR